MHSYINNPEKVKVLMFGWEFPPHNSGGLGVACKGLAKGLVRNNAEILFVLPHAVNVSDADISFIFATKSNAQVRIRTVDTLLLPYISPGSYEARALAKRGVYAQDLFGEVQRYADLAVKIAQEEEYDVIHAHDWLSFSAGVAAKEVSGKPLILHIHLPAVDQSGGGSVDERIFAVEKWAFGKADTIIAISNRVRDVLLERYGVPEEKICVVHNGIDPSEMVHTDEMLSFVDTHPTALYTGRLTMHKGPDTFIRAAQLVVQKIPEARFIIAGSGEMKEQLVELTASLGLSDKIFFHGFYNQKEQARMLNSVNVFVMPSVAEPFGLVALESMLAKVPTIISKQSGASEVLAHALKVDFWDVRELANKILAIFMHKPLSNMLAREGQCEVQKQTWDATAEKCITIYNMYCATNNTTNK